MFDSHIAQYGYRKNYAVTLGGRWFLLSLCNCGRVHAYTPLDEEPGPTIPRMPDSEMKKLGDEITNHIIERTSEKTTFPPIPVLSN